MVQILKGRHTMVEITANIGFEETLSKAADKLRGSMDASEYKHLVLGLIFLKYISDKFETKYDELVAEGEGFEEEKDLLGRVYEYFLDKFADAEGKGGGEFYTPTCVVKTLVKMIEPYRGRIYDPCCGERAIIMPQA